MCLPTKPKPPVLLQKVMRAAFSRHGAIKKPFIYLCGCHSNKKNLLLTSVVATAIKKSFTDLCGCHSDKKNLLLTSVVATAIKKTFY